MWKCWDTGYFKRVSHFFTSAVTPKALIVFLLGMNFHIYCKTAVKCLYIYIYIYTYVSETTDVRYLFRLSWSEGDLCQPTSRVVNNLSKTWIFIWLHCHGSPQVKGQYIFGHYPTIHPLQLGDTHFIYFFELRRQITCSTRERHFVFRYSLLLGIYCKI